MSRRWYNKPKDIHTPYKNQKLARRKMNSKLIVTGKLLLRCLDILIERAPRKSL